MMSSPSLLVTLLLFAAYFALLVWALRRQKQIVQGPWLFFLRAFFPNWKFYHAIGRPPRLYVRGQTPSGEWGIWQQVYPRRKRKLWHLVHNADVNLALSHQNLVDHLAADINDLPENADLRECVSYQLVARLARTALSAQVQAYQFELRLDSPQGEDAMCMLQSPVLTA
jgi:hypothetical protein